MDISIKELSVNYFKNRLNLTVEDIEHLLQDVFDDGVKMGWLGNQNKARFPNPQPHYDNSNGSLYKFAEDHKLNSWEFDIIKRIVRTRKKGNFKEDLQKTKDVIDLYLSEYKLPID